MMQLKAHLPFTNQIVDVTTIDFVKKEITWMFRGHLENRESFDDVTILRPTGLKDKNGIEIYEDDILDGSWINPMSQELVKRHYKVTFDKANFYAQLIGNHPYGTTMLYFENEKGEVIGNIYDNPELLGEDKHE